MKINDIVKFKKIVDKGDDLIKMKVLEVYEGRALVEDLIGWNLNPTHVYATYELEVIECPACYGKGFINNNNLISNCSICGDNRRYQWIR